VPEQRPTVPEQEPLPPWAALPPAADGPAHDGPAAAGPPSGGRTRGGRAQRAAARRRRRWLVMAALAAVAGGVIVAVLRPGSPAPPPVTPDGLITTFQPGELQTVPNACQSVPAATVQHYLPGRVSTASPLQVGGSAESACDWTLDRPPVYRLLQLNLLAYAPNGLASGNGSATDAAVDAYAQAEQSLARPARNSAEPRATVTPLAGLGDQAFSAVQVFRRGGAVTDVATVVVRYHNVVVTVTVNGLDHSNRGTYGPVSTAALSAAALAFAQAAETGLH
jgi:hypothetical protein